MSEQPLCVSTLPLPVGRQESVRNMIVWLRTIAICLAAGYLRTREGPAKATI
jgi:hypothetical protein